MGISLRAIAGKVPLAKQIKKRIGSLSIERDDLKKKKEQVKTQHRRDIFDKIERNRKLEIERQELESERERIEQIVDRAKDEIYNAQERRDNKIVLERYRQAYNQTIQRRNEIKKRIENVEREISENNKFIKKEPDTGEIDSSIPHIEKRISKLKDGLDRTNNLGSLHNEMFSAYTEKDEQINRMVEERNRRLNELLQIIDKILNELPNSDLEGIKFYIERVNINVDPLLNDLRKNFSYPPGYLDNVLEKRKIINQEFMDRIKELIEMEVKQIKKEINNVHKFSEKDVENTRLWISNNLDRKINDIHEHFPEINTNPMIELRNNLVNKMNDRLQRLHKEERHILDIKKDARDDKFLDIATEKGKIDDKFLDIATEKERREKKEYDRNDRKKFGDIPEHMESRINMDLDDIERVIEALYQQPEKQRDIGAIEELISRLDHMEHEIRDLEGYFDDEINQEVRNFEGL